MWSITTQTESFLSVITIKHRLQHFNKKRMRSFRHVNCETFITVTVLIPTSLIPPNICEIKIYCFHLSLPSQSHTKLSLIMDRAADFSIGGLA